MDSQQPRRSAGPWDVPFFGGALVAPAPVHEELARAHGAPTAPPAVRPTRRTGSVWPLIVVAAITIASIVVRTHVLVGTGPLGVVGLGSMPPAGHEEARTPLGHPGPVAFPSGSYRFIEHQEGSTDPVTYDPCRPIHYVVNPAREPVGAAQEVLAAVAAASRATGLTFINDGPTTEAYDANRPIYQPGRYGRRWAPVLIDFTRAADNPEFRDGPVGVGGSSYVRTADRHLTFVTGAIDIDADTAGRLVSDPRAVPLRAIVEHELGHVVGLAHVNDLTQLMYPSAGHGVTSYGSGDLTGLAILGTGRCEPSL